MAVPKLARTNLCVIRSIFIGLLLLSTKSGRTKAMVIYSVRKKSTSVPAKITNPIFPTTESGCSLSTGSWVEDNNSSVYPSYTADCLLVAPEYNCQKFGRQDTGYLRYIWQPSNCNLPRFDGMAFLKYSQGKTVLFVGDSLGRDQWNSLICMILAKNSNLKTQFSDGDPLASFTFLDYDVKFYFYKARYLVDVDKVNGQRVLKLDDISGNGNVWIHADILVFNTGHWWNHYKSSIDWDAMEYQGVSYPDMDRLVALQKALTTWARWVDSHINPDHQRVFFSSVSPKHFQCFGKKEPLKEAQFPEDCAEQMKVVDDVIGKMENPPYLIDITTMSSLRIDAHPSIYSGELSPQQKARPDLYADCSHWCLPGLPDTWNELFAAALFN